MAQTTDTARRAPHLLAGCLGLALLALPLPGQAQQTDDAMTLDEVQAEFAEAFQAIGAYSAEQRDEALAATETTLARIDGRIEDLEGRIRDEWSEMSDATREQTQEALAELRERRNRLSQAYGALSQGAGTAWDDLTAGIGAAWSDLQEAWTDAEMAVEDETGD